MTDPLFVDELPPDGRSQRSQQLAPLTPLVEKLRGNPGRWAEIARYPRGHRSTAASRGSYIAKRYGLEHATRTVGDEIIVFLRAAA